MTLSGTNRLVVLALLLAVSGVVMLVVGNRPTPRQTMTLAPIVERGTEVLKAADQVGLAVVRMSSEDSRKLDDEILRQIPPSGPGSEEVAPRDQAYAEGILAQLERFTSFEPRPRIRVIEYPDPNAFALPGGTILVTTEMLGATESEAEIASVIAHEMGHHKLGHPMARVQYERAARKLGGPLLSDLASLGYALYSRGYSARTRRKPIGRGSRSRPPPATTRRRPNGSCRRCSCVSAHRSLGLPTSRRRPPVPHRTPCATTS